MHVDAGEHLGVDLGPLGREFDRTAAHIVAAAFEDQHHVVGGAAAGTRQHRFQRAGREVQAPVFSVGSVRRAVHHERVAAPGFRDKTHARPRAKRPGPADCAFHDVANPVLQKQ